MTDIDKSRPKTDAGPHILGRPPGLVAIIIYKATWGAIETAAGILVFFSYRLMAAELLEDPQDRFLNWILNHLSYRGSLKLGALFVILGSIKLILAGGLLYHAKLTRQLGIAFFSGVACFGLLHLTTKFSWLEAGVLTVDVVILYYFWRILPRHFHDPGVS